MPMKDYTLTVREVLENLATLAESYEKVSRGGSPTGNYFFAINVADMAASLKAAQVLIAQLPCWIPVSERLPDDDAECLVVESDGTRRVARFDAIGDGNRPSWYEQAEFRTVYPVAWMPLPPPPAE